MALRIVLLLVAFPLWAAEVAGVRIDEKTRVADTELGLTGAGLRRREDFYRALLRIWLGEKPVQEDLKKSLLGT